MATHQLVAVSDEALEQLTAMDAPAQSPVASTLAGVAPIQTWMEQGQVLPDIGDVDKKILASVGNTNTILMSCTTRDILETITVSIGVNGNWEVGGVDTGIAAQGTAPENIPRPVGLYKAVVLQSSGTDLVIPTGLEYTVLDGGSYYTLTTVSPTTVPVTADSAIITINKDGLLKIYPLATSLWTIPPSEAVVLIRASTTVSPAELAWVMPTVHNAWVMAASTEGFARLAQAAAITAQQAGELAATAVIQANAALSSAQEALTQATTLKAQIELIYTEVQTTATELNTMLTQAIDLNTQAIASATVATEQATIATGAATIAVASKDAAKVSEDNAKEWHDKVVAMAAPIAAMLYYAGNWDASSGLFPPPPPAGDDRTPAYVCAVRGVIANAPYYVGDLIGYNRSLARWEVLSSEARDLLERSASATVSFNADGQVETTTAVTPLGTMSTDYSYTAGELTSVITDFAGIRETVTFERTATYSITAVYSTI